MPIQVAITGVDYGQNTETVYGTLTFTGNYPANGDPLSFLGFDQIKASNGPIRVYIQEQPAVGAAQLQSGFQYCYNNVPNLTGGPASNGLATGKVQVLQGGGSAAPSAEFPAGAYPAAIKNAVVVFEAVFAAV